MQIDNLRYTISLTSIFNKLYYIYYKQFVIVPKHNYITIKGKQKNLIFISDI